MINLLLILHNHQPVGNFDGVFRDAFAKCYWPFLECLQLFPDIKVSLHHSGPLLDWACVHEPNYLPTLERLVKEGQVEVLGGGYYEPILAVIPLRDAAGQLQMMQDFWKQRVGLSPRGIWMTERIWEPTLASFLAEQGIVYTVLDDEHFRAAGMIDDAILNYYLTERHGKTVAIFPSDRKLRYLIPFRPVDEVIAYLKGLAKNFSGSAVTYGDDGEKFGLWPGTHDWVVKQGWLKSFFTRLVEQRQTIVTTTPSSLMMMRLPAGTVYLPTSSYPEMGEWSLPARAIHRFQGLKHFLEQQGKWEEAKAFMRGGIWDLFFAKYPESNYMHKRMLSVSSKLAARDLGDPQWDEARRALYRSQCNCAYWHGLFGGLYLNYLRAAVWSNILEAQNLLEGEDDRVRVEKFDIDCDGCEEILLSNRQMIAVISPAASGSLVELSYRPARLNLTDVLAAREEAYHQGGDHEAEEGKGGEGGVPSIHDRARSFPTDGPLSFDTRRRTSFYDYPIGYRVQSLECVGEKAFLVLEGVFEGLKILKTYTLHEDAKLSVCYQIKGGKGTEVFSTELNLSLLAGNDPSRFILLPSGKKTSMDASGTLDRALHLSLVDEYLQFALNIHALPEMRIEYFPVRTVSQSESNFELLYQGSCIIWRALTPLGFEGEEISFTLAFQGL